MYLFEVLSDCHLTPEQLSAYKDNFMGIFAKSLTDREMLVKVGALKALTSFLTSLEDSSEVAAYSEVVPLLLSTVVDALKFQES